MKKVFILLLALLSSSALASLEDQMNWVKGDWDGGKYVIRVEGQSDDEVSILRCDRAIYFSTDGKRCSYDFKLTGQYHRLLDAFYILPTNGGDVAKGICAFSLYHNPFYTADLYETSNPYKIDDQCGTTGSVQVWHKVNNP